MPMGRGSDSLVYAADYIINNKNSYDVLNNICIIRKFWEVYNFP